MPISPATGSGTAAAGGTLSIRGLTSKDAIERYYGTVGIDAVLDDLSGSLETDAVYQCIQDAEETIILRLPMYDPADLVGVTWITSRATWIAAYFLSKRRGNAHYFEHLYMEAIRELEAIISGEIPPPVEIPLRDYSYPSMTNYVMDERFTVKKIRARELISVGGTYAGKEIAMHGYAWGWW